MDRKKAIGVLVLLLALVGIWLAVQEKPKTSTVEAELTITALSVGEADALIIKAPNQNILVDTGEADDAYAISRKLEQMGIEKLDLMVITHFDKDHVGSAAVLLEHIETDAVYMPDYEGSRPEYRDLLKVLEEKTDITVKRVKEPEQISKEDMELTLYPAEDPGLIQKMEAEYDNDMSLVMSLRYKDCSFLLTGDIEKYRMEQMLESGVNWKHDWIKMPHHGRYKKKLKDLMDAVQPKFAVICTDESDPPEDKTLDLLSKEHVETYDTMKRAVITETDGVQILVHYE